MESYMDTAPHQVIRMVQLGRRDDVLSTHAIWLCASCFTCTTRCPREFDLARAMDSLRELAIGEGRKPPEGKVLAFHKAFLHQLRKYGRLFELGLIGEYKLRTRAFMQDVDVAPPMLFKGKLKFFPRKIRGTGEIRRIFARAKEEAESRSASS
jgi:heterodisulfide reductase subunit C